MRTRRSTHWVPALLVLALAASACGTGEQAGPEPAQTEPATSPAPTSPSPPPAEPGPSGPQELVVGAQEDSHERAEPEANIGQYPLNANIFETLVVMTPEYELVPGLATEWEFVEPNTWRFTLREGVTFHDGSPLTAQDVVHSMSRIAARGGGTLRIDENSTVAVDDRTVEITPTVTNRRLVEQLVHPQNSIIRDGTAIAEEQIGTGPFRMVEYVQQERLVVERNDGYWGEAPALERITFQYIPEPNARRLALEAGDVDVMLEVPLESARPVEGAGFALAIPPVGITEAMYINVDAERTHPALLELPVRQAIEHAIDRQALVDEVFDGLASPEQTFTPARLLGDAADLIQGYPYDPDAARSLLDEAGWTEGPDGIRQKDGQTLRLVLVNGFPSSQVHGAVPEFLQALLGDVGIDVEIATTPDRPAYSDRLAAGDGHLWLEQGSQNDANPSFFPALLFWEEGLFGHGSYQPLFAPGWPPGEEERIGDGTFDELIEQGLASPDPQEVRRLTAEALHLMIDEHAILVPLAGLSRIHAHAPFVHGFQAHPSSLQIRWDGLFLSR